MLGLGNTLTASNPIEGIIQLGSLAILLGDTPDDENVLLALSFTDSAINSATNFDGVSTGDKLSGTFTATFTRLDSSDSPVAGAVTTGEVFGYKGATAGVIYLSDTNQSNFSILTGFSSSGSGLIDLTAFGDVTDITDNSVSSSNYTAEVSFTAPGYTTTSVTSSATALNTA